MSDFEDDADLLRLKRRRKEKQAKRRLMWVIGAGVLGAIVLLFVAVALVARPGSGPGGRAPIFGGPSNHAELADMLRKKGIKVEVGPAGALFDMPDRTGSGFKITTKDGWGIVLVYLCKDTGAAKETAASFGTDGFYYDRFAFRPGLNDKVDADATLMIRSALNVR